jgi:uncharacterized Zn finger protein
VRQPRRRHSQEKDLLQQRSAAAARQRHLDELAVDQPSAWRRVADLIETKKPREYDTAVQILVDLRDISERDGHAEPFRQQLGQLRALHARKPSLLQRLYVVGLDV